MSEFGIGIVGLGWVAGAHIEAFKEVQGASVRAVCSRRKHDPADLEAQFGIPLKAYTDYDSLLSDPAIDVIDICTPHPLHPEQAIAAARAKKHVIIEKPIAIDYESAKAIRSAVREAGVHAAVCFEARYSAHFTMIRSVLDQGLLGDIHYGEIDYYHGIGPWYGQFEWNVKKDFGGSSLLTAGCHSMGLASLLPRRPGRGSHQLPDEIEEPDLCPVRVRDHQRHASQVQERESGEGGLGCRLPAALLLPRAPRR